MSVVLNLLKSRKISWSIFTFNLGKFLEKNAPKPPRNSRKYCLLTKKFIIIFLFLVSHSPPNFYNSSGPVVEFEEEEDEVEKYNEEHCLENADINKDGKIIVLDNDVFSPIQMFEYCEGILGRI